MKRSVGGVVLSVLSLDGVAALGGAAQAGCRVDVYVSFLPVSDSLPWSSHVSM